MLICKIATLDFFSSLWHMQDVRGIHFDFNTYMPWIMIALLHSDYLFKSTDVYALLT